MFVYREPFLVSVSLGTMRRAYTVDPRYLE